MLSPKKPKNKDMRREVLMEMVVVGKFEVYPMVV